MDAELEDAKQLPAKIHFIRQELRGAVMELSARGLKMATKFAAEQLAGLRPETEAETTPSTTTTTSTMHQAATTGPAALSDTYLAAKAYFDLGEYQRAAYTLKPDGGPNPGLLLRGGGGSSSSSGGGASSGEADRPEEVFLRCYALYLAGEKSKEERMLEVSDPLERCQVANLNLKPLAAELGDLYHRRQLDGFGLYIYGVILKELQPSLPAGAARVPTASANNDSAQVVLVESILAYPWNWSAWLDLAELCLEADSTGSGNENDNRLQAEALQRLSQFWMFEFFQTHLFLEQHQSEQAFHVLQRLAKVFPNSSHVIAHTAIAHYNMRDFEESEANFQVLRQKDPYRLENLERYSDILYVKESKAELSQLAHMAAKNDKYRPETCCIIGNYYSLKAQHEKAVIYFQRALKLNRKFLFAWTLMGHGFLEMKNTGAAIEAYRRAVDINPRDFRAWYGLGQTYELLQMYFYALYYYRKATTLRPFDARMWCAMGVCYERLDRRQEAIKSYERAMCNHDREGIATAKLAKLYREDGERAKAAHCYQKHLEARERQQVDSADTVEALLFLAHYHKTLRDFDLATQYCNRLLDYPGREQEEAKALLREIRSLSGGTTTRGGGGGASSMSMQTD